MAKPASIDGPRSKGRPRSFDRTKALEAALRTFWQRGYEPASVPELCAAMGVNPPSMYAAFGSKVALFIEAMEHYELAYWAEPGRRFLAEPDLRRAVAGFFDEAARILLSPETPCGCMASPRWSNPIRRSFPRWRATPARRASRATFSRG